MPAGPDSVDKGGVPDDGISLIGLHLEPVPEVNFQREPTDFPEASREQFDEEEVAPPGQSVVFRDARWRPGALHFFVDFHQKFDTVIGVFSKDGCPGHARLGSADASCFTVESHRLDSPKHVEWRSRDYGPSGFFKRVDSSSVFE